MDGLTDQEADRLSLLSYLIDDTSSVFQQKMLEALPAASASCYVLTGTPAPILVFEAEGVNGEDAETFCGVVFQLY